MVGLNIKVAQLHFRLDYTIDLEIFQSPNLSIKLAQNHSKTLINNQHQLNYILCEMLRNSLFFSIQWKTKGKFVRILSFTCCHLRTMIASVVIINFLRYVSKSNLMKKCCSHFQQILSFANKMIMEDDKRDQIGEPPDSAIRIINFNARTNVPVR